MIITTKYRGPTDNSGSSILAYCGADKRPMRVKYNPALNETDNHTQAAKLRAAKSYGNYNDVKTCETYALPDAANHYMVHIVNRPKG